MIQYLVSMMSLLIFSMVGSCNGTKTTTEHRVLPTQVVTPDKDLSEYSVAYLASGCFWCVEAVFESVEGVEEAVSGYAGGSADDATYKKVSAGVTDHTEAVAVYYDPEVIDFKTLLVVYFDSMDPTTPNRQGPDRGRQYRSSIFYQNPEEKQISETFISELDASGKYNRPIAVEVVPYEAFYEAEAYHQDYERRNANQPYIRSVSVPRLKKFQKLHPELLKDGASAAH